MKSLQSLIYFDVRHQSRIHDQFQSDYSLTNNVLFVTRGIVLDHMCCKLETYNITFACP